MRFPRFIFAWLIASLGMKAQEAPQPAILVPDAPPPTRERAVSPRVAALLSAAMPKFAAPTPSAPDAEAILSRPRVEEPVGAAIVRLPTYLVRERKLPSPDEVDRRETERRMMEKYLGPEDGLDRGFLNLITAKQFPLLAIFGSRSNEDRAMARYREDERLRLKTELLELASLTKRAGDVAGGEKLKKEVQQTFRHD